MDDWSILHTSCKIRMLSQLFVLNEREICKFSQLVHGNSDSLKPCCNFYEKTCNRWKRKVSMKATSSIVSVFWTAAESSNVIDKSLVLLDITGFLFASPTAFLTLKTCVFSDLEGFAILVLIKFGLGSSSTILHLLLSINSPGWDFKQFCNSSTALFRWLFMRLILVLRVIILMLSASSIIILETSATMFMHGSFR